MVRCQARSACRIGRNSRGHPLERPSRCSHHNYRQKYPPVFVLYYVACRGRRTKPRRRKCRDRNGWRIYFTRGGGGQRARRRGHQEFGGNNVQCDGGTATGSFVYDTSTNRYTNWSKTLSSGDFTAFAYDPTNSTAQTCCSDLISLTHTSLTRVLEIEYDNAGDAADSPQITRRV